jgi:hypothetical protein
MVLHVARQLGRGEELGGDSDWVCDMLGGMSVIEVKVACRLCAFVVSSCASHNLPAQIKERPDSRSKPV